jgi:5'-nucleotidase
VAETWVLVTNDDGVDSPALAPLLEELGRRVEVRAVVPAAECSWTAKVMSRFRPVEVSRAEQVGHPVWAVTGYPADCANLGIHTLFPSPPALLVSGVNMGNNAGLAYLLSSGTVGAALEGALAGVPAAAFSVQLDDQDYARWRGHRELSPAVGDLLSQAAKETAEIAAEVLAGGLPAGADLLNVNLPATLDSGTARRFAPVTRTAYGPYFTPANEDGGYRYRFSGLRVTVDDPDGDLAVLARGEVAMTAVRLSLGKVPEAADRARFERPGGPGRGPAR